MNKKIQKFSEELQGMEIEFTKGMKRKYLREILVNEKIYPGVSIVIRNIEKKTDKIYENVKIYEKDENIIFEPIQ